MREHAEHPLRPGALCIPPHLHGAIFAPRIDAEARGCSGTPCALAGHTHPCFSPTPASPASSPAPQRLAAPFTSTSMCADRPSPSERRYLAPNFQQSPAPATAPAGSRTRTLMPRSAYAEHSIIRLPPYEDAAHPRLVPRSAYAEHTSVEIPAYSERERAHPRLVPRSAYSEHVTVEIPPYEPKDDEGYAPVAGHAGEKAWLERGGLPVPTSTPTPKPKSKTWSRRLIAVLVLLVWLPLTYLMLSNELELWETLDALPPSLSSSSLFSSSHSTDTHANANGITVPPLDYEWWKRCTDLLVVPKATYSNRIDKLTHALDGAAWVGEPGPSAEYYLGAFGRGAWKPSERPFLIAVKDGKITMLTPAFEESRARLLALPEEVAERVTWVSWTEDRSPYAALVQALEDVPIVIDADVRNFIASGIRAAQSLPVRVQQELWLRNVSAAVASIRERKDEREVGLLRCANEATLHAIRKTRARMYIGIHESQTRAILYEEMHRVGLSDYSALVLFGPNAALPHGSGTDRALQVNEFALIDAGGRWGGYLADITRTFFLPDSVIPEAHQTVWEIVRAAQRAPANFLRLIEPGEEALFSWLDDRARETVKKGMAALGVPPAKGHAPDYTVFTHRTGHGIGLEGHESPYVVQGALGERQVLPGHTFTLEPGVYVPHDSEVGDEQIRGLGVRLEDTVVLVEKDGRLGVEWLTGPVEKWGDV